ncbi:MAG: hypothetical protein METHP_01984 [Methanoregula sp. SKADARSKE-2]|nr:MAG: hypothetical protein METHP_01984 [Methanoregula sp. SKADARSKE-2]
MYLGLPERKAYLNAIRPADDRDFGSIAAMLITTCLHQHRDVSDTVNAGMEETRVIPGTDTLAKEFVRLKKQNSSRKE